MNPSVVILCLIAIYYFLKPSKTSKELTLIREYNIGMTNKFRPIAKRMSLTVNLDENLIMAIIAQESAGIPTAIGSSGEIGLMQIMPVALQDVNEVYGTAYNSENLTDIEINIEVGARYLAWLQTKCNGNIQKAIQSYNAGLGAVSKNPNISLKYYQSVRQYWQIFTERA